MSIRLADRSFQYPVGIAENIMIKVGKFTFPVDFVILEMEEDSKVPLILGRPFLHTADAIIHVKNKQLTLGVGNERVAFTIDKAMMHPYSTDESCFSVDVIDQVLEEEIQGLLGSDSELAKLMETDGMMTEEELLAAMDANADEEGGCKEEIRDTQMACAEEWYKGLIENGLLGDYVMGEEKDFNPERELEELARLLTDDPTTHPVEIKCFVPDTDQLRSAYLPEAHVEHLIPDLISPYSTLLDDVLSVSDTHTPCISTMHDLHSSDIPTVGLNARITNFEHDSFYDDIDLPVFINFSLSGQEKYREDTHSPCCMPKILMDEEYEPPPKCLLQVTDGSVGEGEFTYQLSPT